MEKQNKTTAGILLATSYYESSHIHLFIGLQIIIFGIFSFFERFAWKDRSSLGGGRNLVGISHPTLWFIWQYHS
tara:strand:+ start:651 stop:872 length:222 start_codon:yes stop_codon:yes gene_type:complete